MLFNLISSQIRTARTTACRWSLGRAAAVLFLAAGVCLLTAVQAAASAPGCPDCDYRRPITIAPAQLSDNCGGDITGFPVLVSLESATYLKNVALEGGKVEDVTGRDIAFTDAGGNWLNHEVEFYNPNNGKLVAWVNVPALSKTANTVIYMYYGDSDVSAPTERPEDVWDSDYKAVYHLNQTPTGAPGNILDSTANGNHGQTGNMAAGDLTQSGPIGAALDFEDDDYVSIGDPMASADSQTISAWVKHDTLPAAIERYVSIGNAAGVLRHNGNGQLHYYAQNQSNVKVHLRVNNALTAGEWYYAVGTWDRDGGLLSLYLNGALVASAGNSNKKLKASGGSSITTAGETMDGIIDEVRVSSIARDACWIQTEYNNQSDPAGFYAIGSEESLSTYIITATASANGSISPAGEVLVEEGGSQVFFLEAVDEDYEVDQVSVNGVLLEDFDSAHYEFTNVTANGSIHVTFKTVADGAPDEDDVLPPGCSENIATSYSEGFEPENLDIVNCSIDADRYIMLDTGNHAINPDSIVIPFRQQVAVTFMYERGNHENRDFGWMLASEGPTFAPEPHRIVYENINDSDNNGVLDVSGDNASNRFGDRNGDGTINALDNREVLGTFDAGTELVFFLKIDDMKYRDDEPVQGYADGDGDDDDDDEDDNTVTDFADEDQQVYHYSKTAWNQSRFTSRETISNPQWSCHRSWGDPFEKIYSLGLAQAAPGACEQRDGWMDPEGIARAADPFGLTMDENDVSSIWVDWDERWPAVMVGAPANDPNAWILGFEDVVGGGDADHNDVIFIIERETGGTAGLKPSQPITPTNVDDNINGVTLAVYDFMPDEACAGLTEITYWLSIDAGTTWVEVDGWDEVYSFTLVDGEKILGDPVTNWTPGAPAYTFRSRRVDFTELGLSGRQLIWRADLKSRREGCEPKIMDMALDMTVGVPGHIARSTPTVLANVMFSGSMETPAADWTSAELRGHLKTTRIYDPADPSRTASLEQWDAGDVLKNRMEPDGRTILMPDVTVSTVDVANAEQLAVGDGVTITFRGRLAHSPLLATTVRITDARETFDDRHTDVLDGSLGGEGWINRFYGIYEITFQNPPNLGQPITAVYSHFSYNAGGIPRGFTENNVRAAELGLDDSEAIPSGYIYDFNRDGAFSAEDVNWLINWTRGYRDGNGKLVEKEWVLGAIDHSVPAVATPPVFAPWYYGTAFPEDTPNSTQDRKGYRDFMDTHADRRTVVYVGARDGMLHAFDAGPFRWGDNPCTNDVENRGYFQWTEPGDPDPTACEDPCSIDCRPDYGTGEELWAFIPANLLPRLKYNYMQGDDKSYVDASAALADVHTDGAWRTVLLSAEGNGGDTVFCLDVTDPDSPKFMWEFADPFLFRSRSSPAVAQIGRIFHGGTTRWAAFFVSGKKFHDTLYPMIFVLDIANGRLLGRIYLSAVPAGVGGVLSGQPAIVDSDGNGYLDRLYVGSDKGLLYKVNIPDNPSNLSYGLSHCVINTDYTDRDGDPVPAEWQYQPIYGSPTVVSSNSVDANGQMAYDVRIYFGTGDSPYYDEDINFDNTRYFFYAYRDTADKGQCDDSAVSLDWFFELPAGHRVYASAFAAAGNIYFGTSTGETADPCDIDANRDSGFDPNAGRLYAFSMENPTGLPLLEREVGNVLAAPVVTDRHIYVQSVSGDVDSFGSGQYNSAIRQGGIPQVEISWWREMY